MRSIAYITIKGRKHVSRRAGLGMLELILGIRERPASKADGVIERLRAHEAAQATAASRSQEAGQSQEGGHNGNS